MNSVGVCAGEGIVSRDFICLHIYKAASQPGLVLLLAPHVVLQHILWSKLHMDLAEEKQKKIIEVLSNKTVYMYVWHLYIHQSSLESSPTYMLVAKFAPYD